MTETIIKRKRKVCEVVTKNELRCLRCGHDHEDSGIITYYNKRNIRILSCLCDECYYPMRMSKTTRGYYVFGNQQQNRQYIKIDWHDVFRDCKIHVSDNLKNWLIKHYTPPRKVKTK